MIKEFQGEYRWLSNFWPALVHYETVPYPSVEHAYQAAKFLDDAVRKEIRLAPTAGIAKRLGKRKGARPDWDALKLTVMEMLVREKFNQEPFRSKLIATGEQELQEGNRWGDTFWGVCNGRGKNHLGKLIMIMRREIMLDKDSQVL